MNTDFVLIAEKFTPNAADHAPGQIDKCCKWFEDMLTLKNPDFKDLTATPQREFYQNGLVKSVGWMYTPEKPVRVFVNEDGDWRIRYVPTKKLAKRYIKEFGGSGPIFWFFYDINKVKMIEAED